MNDKIEELEAKISELSEQIKREYSEDKKILLCRFQIKCWVQIRELKLKK